MIKLKTDITFKFVKGEDLVIADILSRATVEVHYERPRIMSTCMDPDISDVRLEDVRKATEDDSELQRLITYITEEWPEKKRNHFYDLRETLIVNNGTVVKGEPMVIPK